jgi:hypothetical protein
MRDFLEILAWLLVLVFVLVGAAALAFSVDWPAP